MKVAHDIESQELSEKFILENTHKTILIVNKKTEFGNYDVIAVSEDAECPKRIIITASALEKFSASSAYHIIHN